MKEILKRFVPDRLKNFLWGMERNVRLVERKMHWVPLDERVSFDAQTVYRGHLRVTYRGIAAIRCPFEYVMYQMIISDLEPDLIIEIGTNAGGGALYLGDLLQTIGRGIVHSIDIQSQVSAEIISKHPRIKLFTEGWENYDLAQTSGFSRILVIEDAAHTYECSLGALHKFAPIVTMDSYFIVEDGIVDELGMRTRYQGGPLRAIREFLNANNNFKVDRTYCDMFGKNATFNVNGYLKRIS